MEIAREAIVLLKNDGELLPLDASKLKRIVVVGDNAITRHAPGGHSSGVKALYEVTPLEGLRHKLAESIEIQFFQGYPTRRGEVEAIDPHYLSIADAGSGTRGWKAHYWQKRYFAGEVIERAEVSIDFEWDNVAPFPNSEAGQFSATWETCAHSAGGGFLRVHSRRLAPSLLAHRWHRGPPPLGGRRGDHGQVARPPSRGRLPAAGRAVAVAAGPPYQARLDPPWVRDAKEDDDALLVAASRADAVLFLGGLSHQYDLEGTDRKDMALHEGQNELIARLAEVNPKIAVVLVSGSPVEMPWVSQVPAIVQMWYAGMEGGHAIAEVLLGHSNPSGKLPITFPRVLEDSPAHALNDYDPDVCFYREGIFVGYRWFDVKRIEPLFPFGHGLSYTKFELASLKVERGQRRLRCAEHIQRRREARSRGGASICRANFLFG